MAILDDLAAYIATAGHGTVGTNLFKGHLPAQPDAAIALYEYQGEANVNVFGGAAAINERPRVQVRVRGALMDYPTARTKIQSIYRLLDAVEEEDLSGTRYNRIAALQAPFSLGVDANDRPEFACNFSVVKRT